MLGGLKLMLDDAAPDLLPYLLPYLRSQPEAASYVLRKSLDF
jgi:hypothetical protein